MKKFLITTLIILTSFTVKAADLYQGCCSYHSGASYCHATNSIMCSDGKFSPTCTCNFDSELVDVENLFKFNNDRVPERINSDYENAISDINELYANSLSRAEANVAHYGNNQARSTLESLLQKKESSSDDIVFIRDQLLEDAALETNEVLNIYMAMKASAETLKASNVAAQAAIEEKARLAKEEALAAEKEVMMRIFPDVPRDSTEYEAAIYLKNKDVIKGNPDGSFGGEKPVNRAELAKMLLIAKGVELEGAKEKINYTDVSEKDWFWIYVAKATQLGIIKGDPDGSFRPGSPVNRAELIKMISISLDLGEDLNHKYTDIASNAWYEKYLGNVKTYNLFPEEYYKVWFKPQQPVTRYETAVAIYNILINSY